MTIDQSQSVTDNSIKMNLSEEVGSSELGIGNRESKSLYSGFYSIGL